MSEQAHHAPQHVVVCGGGVIGACTAYFLAQKGVQVTVVERNSVACAASGKAGGFLALDWCDTTAVGKLARASFRLHEQLAEELGGEEYGYRRLDSLGFTLEEEGEGEEEGVPTSEFEPSPLLPAWVDGRASEVVCVMGSRETNAQVHPLLFTRKVLDTAIQKFGAKLVIGEVKEIRLEQQAGGGRVTGVVVGDDVLAADAAVIAMGPWCAKNQLVASLTRVHGLIVQSMVVYPHEPEAITAHALFLGYRTKEGKSLDPEIYPRGSGEVYVCGSSREAPVPDDPDDIRPTKEESKYLAKVAAAVSSKLAKAEVRAEQACFLPCSEDELPLIGQIPNVRGAFVGTGHGCWGILLAPATGVSLAELIVQGCAETVDLTPFDPARFSTTCTTT